MSSPKLTPPQAELEMALLSAQADSTSSSDLYARLKQLGLSDEAAIRLKNFMDYSLQHGKKTVAMGKMVVLRIIDFVKAHPNLTLGVAVGAAIGALVGAIPLLGPLLGPVATILGVAVFAVGGNRLDKDAQGEPYNNRAGIVAIGQEVIDVARAFFDLFVDIYTLVFGQKNLVGEGARNV